MGVLALLACFIITARRKDGLANNTKRTGEGFKRSTQNVFSKKQITKVKTRHLKAGKPN